MKKLIATAVLLSALCFNVRAQRLEVGIFAGGTVFNGDVDVTVNNFLPQVRYGGGLLAKYNFTEAWVGRVQFNSGFFYADEKLYPSSPYRSARGLNFTSTISDITAVMEWHPFGLTPQFRLTQSGMYISFYGFGGVGETFSNPTSNFTPQTDATITKTTANYPKNAFILPIGGGARWHINDNFTLNAEIGGRKVFSSYADGIYANPDSRSKDYYFFGGLTLTYLFCSNKHRNQSDNPYLRAVNSGGASCPTFHH